jgi:hypothetical protein
VCGVHTHGVEVYANDRDISSATNVRTGMAEGDVATDPKHGNGLYQSADNETFLSAKTFNGKGKDGGDRDNFYDSIDPCREQSSILPSDAKLFEDLEIDLDIIHEVLGILSYSGRVVVDSVCPGPLLKEHHKRWDDGTIDHCTAFAHELELLPDGWNGATFEVTSHLLKSSLNSR